VESLTGTSLAVFVGLTVVLFGGATAMMGQALADTWRPAWQNAVYGLLMGAADRLLGHLLFGGELLSIAGYVVDTAILIVIAFFAYRVTRVHKMIQQYPWLYERSGLLSWQEKPGAP
jgi:branched-chain amino acid transport system ATP-binding protein